ncbi:hypothetical protein CSA56_11865 [candidate division KSB3 bacterium]|uniref:PLAT domain-containing protein n=1 Tax=candidate division KSB3 bacterium TaxID=2044937 RepID=A0A2G6KDB1_9BACT|nr:MAG: hypothetical protein CSA56_11865 [candidate division KSB3 bacterium]
MRPQYKKLYFLLLLLCLIVALTACEENTRQSTPILPGEIAVLTFDFDPDPVTQGYGNEFEFLVTLREVNGVGARLTSMKIEDFDNFEISRKKRDYDEQGIIDQFGTSYIEQFGTLRTRSNHTCSYCVKQTWRIRAEDDQGNHVEGTGTVELIQR